ncbi:precorrin-6y C5,15-methyltransferase (decarboxylating) subunit CbiE, partial [Kitasatospora sp. NPDC057198]
DCARISANARKCGVEVETAAGSGPEVLGALPEPDAVAVEHGGPAMVRAVTARKPGRVVAVARGLAEATETRRILDAAGYRTDGLLLQSAPLRAESDAGAGPSFGRGDYTLLIWGEPYD